MTTRLLLTVACSLPLAGACEDTKNEEIAEANEELLAEAEAERKGEGIVDKEIKGEVAERRGELARDVGATPKAMDDPTSCKAVYDHAIAMNQGDDRLAGLEERPTPPEMQPFVEVCERLPEDVRACMSVGYAYQHASECERAIENLDPALRKKFDRVARPSGEQAG